MIIWNFCCSLNHIIVCSYFTADGFCRNLTVRMSENFQESIFRRGEFFILPEIPIIISDFCCSLNHKIFCSYFNVNHFLGNFTVRMSENFQESICRRGEFFLLPEIPIIISDFCCSLNHIIVFSYFITDGFCRNLTVGRSENFPKSICRRGKFFLLPEIPMIISEFCCSLNHIIVCSYFKGDDFCRNLTVGMSENFRDSIFRRGEFFLLPEIPIIICNFCCSVKHEIVCSYFTADGFCRNLTVGMSENFQESIFRRGEFFLLPEIPIIIIKSNYI